MNTLPVKKNDLNKTFFSDVLFFMIAEGGAMGEPGAVKFIKEDGNLYSFNYVFGDYKYEDIVKAFPPLGKCSFGLFGIESHVPDGWEYVNLGMGNHLIVKTSVYPKFKKLISKYQSMGEVYQNWIKHAEEIMKSKGENKMKNNLTELVFILDKSGSMAGMEADTIGGFNAMIEKQKKEDGDAYVSTVLFSNDSTVLHDRVDLKKIEPMTERDYCVGGGTALLDAIGGAIHHIGNVHKYARPEDVPEHTLFIITTDGMENASRMYSSRKLKEMIKRQEERYGWEFIFIAANIDAVETADNIGIRRERSANYRQDKDGTEKLYACMSEVVCSVRNNAPLQDDWKKNLDCDENK